MKPSRLFARALVLRCPVCSSEGVVKGWFSLIERCPRCHFRFERIVGQQAGYIGMNTILSFGTLGIVVIGGFVLQYPDFSVFPLLVAALLTAVLAPLFFLPFSRLTWCATDLMMRPLEPGEAPGLDASPPPHPT